METRRPLFPPSIACYLTRADAAALLSIAHDVDIAKERLLTYDERMQRVRSAHAALMADDAEERPTRSIVDGAQQLSDIYGKL